SVHTSGPAEPNVEASLCEQPVRLFRAIVTWSIAIQEDRDLAGGKAPRKSLDLRNLAFCDLVPHDRYGRNADRIEPDHIVEYFHHNDAAAGNDFTITRLNEPACMLSKKFLPTVKINREFVFVRLFLLAPLFRR